MINDSIKSLNKNHAVKGVIDSKRYLRHYKAITNDNDRHNIGDDSM